MQCRRPRLFGLVSAALLVITAIANIWGVPSINSQVLPQVTEKASSILDRKVCHHSYVNKISLHSFSSLFYGCSQQSLRVMKIFPVDASRRQQMLRLYEILP